MTELLTPTETEAREDHGRQQARAQAAEIARMVDAANGCKDEDEAREAIQDHPLSIEVRSSWTTAGDKPNMEEFRIVLCTGGPHVEIRGEFDINGQPYRAWLNYQDWGTPLTQFFDIEQSTLLTYCSNFYFG